MTDEQIAEQFGVPGATEHKTTLSPLLGRDQLRNHCPVFLPQAS
jgi:hypothetical protein